MSLISISELKKAYGPEDIFSNVSFSIAKGARYAIVGPNGIGKTTLLRILVGEEEASGGKITQAKNLSIGYLPQEAEFQATGTLWEACLEVFRQLQQQQELLHQLELQMEDSEDTAGVLKRYGKLQQEFEAQGGYTYTTRIKQVLTGLGFASSDFDMAVAHLSGGQRTRAYLAQLLLSDNDLLLLDEPTNHLDIAAIEWLESFLSHWDGAALLVSHDRYFLDKVCNGIYEMTGAGLEIYPGNYTAYLQQRQLRADRRHDIFEAEKNRLLKEVDYIKRNISGQNTLQAKGKLKRLSRIVQAIEQIGFEAVAQKSWIEVSEDVSIGVSPFSVDEAERRVRSLKSPVRTLPSLKLDLRSEARSGDLVIRTSNLRVGFPDRLLFDSPDIVLQRGECAALIGPNGAGKTTFLKTILGQLEPLEGIVTLGASLKIGYFAQAHEDLNPENSLLDEIDTVVPSWLPGQIRDYLGKYLFSGDDVYKQVRLLSGGERGRLALAKLALQDTNLLLLDEPTNHLDIPSQEVLQAVLDEYSGTILLVTHDRYLIDALGTQIWEIDPDGSSLDVFEGTYSLRKQERERLAALRADEADGSGSEKNSRKTPKLGKKTDRKAERRRIAQLQEIENRLVVLEKQLAELGKKLEDPPPDTALVRKWGSQYASIQSDMDELMNEWERLQ